MMKTPRKTRFKKKAKNSFFESTRDFLANSFLRKRSSAKRTTPAAKHKMAVGAEGQRSSANAANEIIF